MAENILEEEWITCPGMGRRELKVKVLKLAERRRNALTLCCSRFDLLGDLIEEVKMLKPS